VKVEFANVADRLRPPEYLFDTFSFALTHLVSGMPRRSLIDSTSPTRVLCNVRRDISLAKSRNEVCGVIALVGAQGDAAIAAKRVDQMKRRLALSCTRCLRRVNPDDQSVSILHERICKIAEHRWRVRALSIKQRLRVGRRLMRVVPAWLSFEINVGIAPRCRWSIVVQVFTFFF